MADDDFDILSLIEMQAAHCRSRYRLAAAEPIEAILPDNVADELIELHGSLEAAAPRGTVLRRRSEVDWVPEEEEADE